MEWLKLAVPSRKLTLMPARKSQVFACKACFILFFFFSFTITAFTQKKINPKIDNSETEISLFHFGEISSTGIGTGQHLTGAQIVRRWSWKKYTKIGAGGLIGVINHDPIAESDVVVYGALFGDITQFIGKRQKWSVTTQVGHGIFKRKREFETASYKGVVKHTAGKYYSISFNRSIILKKLLIVISPNYSFRYFREKATQEIPSVKEYKSISKYSGPGIRFGIVF